MPYTVPQLTDFSATALDDAVRELLAALEQESAAVGSENDWKAFRDRWIARKNGIFTQINDLWLKAAPAAKKRDVGQRVNELKPKVEQAVNGTYARLLSGALFKGRSVGRAKVQDAPLPRSDKSESLQVTPPDVPSPVGADSDPAEAPPIVEEKPPEISERIALPKAFMEWAERTGQPLTIDEAFSKAEGVDITLPGIRRPIGAEHPVIKTMNEMIGVFRNLGYSVEVGPEIETDFYNFEALNFPPNHPARDTQDTLFIAGQESKPLRDRLLLRTHTSPVQIRTMQKTKPPVRVVCPGKVHRNDALDATHSPIFHQIEGLAVDTNITFCDLKGTLDHAMKAMFGSSVKTRFYPSFFPFTEPSADVQISCIFCDGKGVRDGAPCRNCKASGWIELLGCGMVDPNVYGFVDYDPAKVSGFAFGMGVERIAILKYGVDDIQLFFQGDVRFLEQFL
ncbi:MAG TPA: phenylalanine--tRNA ligase subunit alpha [Terriglobales bacterium]|nr:phenylalanine--tRNA ligase subunit alpha [Terriglobales bacterium]